MAEDEIMSDITTDLITTQAETRSEAAGGRDGIDAPEATNGASHGAKSSSEQDELDEDSDGSDDAPLAGLNKSSLFRSGSDSQSKAGDDQEDELEHDDAQPEQPSSQPVASTSRATPKAQKIRYRKSPSKADPTASTARTHPSTVPLPHYTIGRSSPNSEQKPHKIFVNPGISDASTAEHPKAEEWVRGHKRDGRLFWYEAEPPGQGRHLSWRKNLGKELARELSLSETKAGGKPEHWILENFPDDYKFSVHHTAKPGATKERLDVYLWGAPNKFRTVNEFMPHIVWLLTNGPDNPKKCLCKYCSKMTQTDVNRALGRASTPVTSSPARSEAPKSKDSSAQKGRPRKSLLSNVVRAEPEPESPKASKETEEAVSDDDEELPALIKSRPKEKGNAETPVKTAKESGHEKQKEHVKTPEPARPNKRRAISPAYDGAYVNPKRDAHLAPGVRYRESETVWVKLIRPFIGEDGQPLITHWPAVVLSRQIQIDSQRIGVEPDGRTPIFRSIESQIYVVRLLAVIKEMQVADDRMIPYLGFVSLRDEWFVAMMKRPVVRAAMNLVYPDERIIRPRFDELKSWSDAVIPLALAMQILCGIVNNFAPLDVYHPKAKFARTNGQLSSESSLRLKRELEAPFFQRILWGTENIWSGELVRIFAGESQMVKIAKNHARDWKSRAIFLRIAAIWRAADDGDVAERLRVSGRVYELESLYDHFDPTAGTLNGKRASAPPNDDDPRFPALPKPPPGYRWHKLRTENDVAFLVENIAGRYYELPPKLRDNPALTESLRRSALAKSKQEEVEFTTEERAVILAGLVSAETIFIRSRDWVVEPHESFVKAEETAHRAMRDFFASQEQEREE